MPAHHSIGAGEKNGAFQFFKPQAVPSRQEETMPSELSDDIERAMPRGSRERFEHRLLRLVEPAASPESVEPQEPGPDAPRAVQINFWEQAAMWATTSSEYDHAADTLARLRSGRVVAAEPVQAPPVATPKPVIRKVLHREILERDSSGAILRVKEWTAEEPIADGVAPSPANPEA
jgi:hypothetical protein